MSNWLDWLGFIFAVCGLMLGGLLVQRALHALSRRRDASKAVAAVVTAEADAEAARLAQGRAAFLQFAQAWHANWGDIAPQPDRVALMTAMLARSGKVTLAYIDHCGDLRAAMRDVFPDRDVAYTDALAGNIVQVASALSIDELASRIRYTHADSIREKS